MKPIPTKWQGTTYRSRLEARWSVFFGFIGLHAIYEPEGFEHDGETYLPDFWVDEFDGYVEIKPHNVAMHDVDRVREWQLNMAACGMRLFSLFGEPVIDKCLMHDPAGEVIVMKDCRRCNGLCYVLANGWGNFGGHACKDHDKDPIDDRRVRAAMEYAMACRFGENR
jgi:hypothetical protein